MNYISHINLVVVQQSWQQKKKVNVNIYAIYWEMFQQQNLQKLNAS